ncbi:MAG: hypothetical protein KatS3mg120_2424 [Erythrobacter sp.]|nr:MAG: hypothetical protein KatS3mg120_2424 [Erythrobacter sp.]
MTFFKNLLRDEQGATAIEYGLIAALIAVAAITAMTAVGGEISDTFNTVDSEARHRQQDHHAGRRLSRARVAQDEWRGPMAPPFSFVRSARKCPHAAQAQRARTTSLTFCPGTTSSRAESPLSTRKRSSCASA